MAIYGHKRETKTLLCVNPDILVNIFNSKLHTVYRQMHNIHNIAPAVGSSVPVVTAMQYNIENGGKYFILFIFFYLSELHTVQIHAQICQVESVVDGGRDPLACTRTIRTYVCIFV